MKKHPQFELIRRKESSAPNLTPFQYFEGPDFVCCSEVLERPKPKICETSPNPPPVPQVICMGKGKPLSRPCKWEPESNERDILFRPIRWRCNTPNKHGRKESKPSLGSPIGLSKSSFGMNFLEGNPSHYGLQGFATTLVAFAEYFITPEVEWDEKVLNRILIDGHRLYTDSKAKLHEGEKLEEPTIKRTFTLCGNSFDLLVDDAFLMGQVVGQEAAVPNLYWGLLKFFKKFQFCLLQIEDWYTMLWKNADVYFLFDAFGRRHLDLLTDRKHGVAVLLCLRHIENVSHLFLNLSGISPENFFVIRNLQVKSLIPCGGVPTPEIIDRSVEFEVLTQDYALLRASIHLGSVCFKEIRLRHSLPVALCALINAKVDGTPTWDGAVLDKIIKLGAHFYKQWTQCDFSFNLMIEDVPNRFVFGQFTVEIAVIPMAEFGTWKCTPNYLSSDLSQSLKRVFEKGSNFLVQIQGRTYAIWRKGDFYYILDPYSHHCSLEKKKLATASLHMCGSLSKMCCIFTQALLELFEESKFGIHLVKIIKLEESDKLKEIPGQSNVPCMCTAVPQIDAAQETISLNESVIDADGYDCPGEEAPIDSDSADLDSPGLSQTRLEDYTDLRRDFIEESDEETEDDEDEEVDLDSGSDIVPFEETDESDDEGYSKQAPKEKNPKKKTKKPSRRRSEKKSRRENSGSDLSDEIETQNETKKKKDKKKEKSEKKNKESKDKLKKKESKRTLFRAEEREQSKEKKSNKEDKKHKEKNEKDASKKKQHEKPQKQPDQQENLISQEKDNPVKDNPLKGNRREHEQITGQIEEANVEHETIYIDVIEEDRNDTPEPEPIDQDSPPDRRRSKGDTPIVDRSSSEVPKVSTAPTRRQRHQRRKQQDGDDSSSSDEIPRGRMPLGCKPNCYPGFTKDPQNLAVVGSESGSYESLCNLLKSAFRCADRILTMTPWGNYVAFRLNGAFLIFDGCTCNLRSIRHMDLSVGTAGLLCFPDMHSLIIYIESGKERKVKKPTTYSEKDIVDQICSKYCSR